MLETLAAWFAAIDTWTTTASASRAIVVGLLMCWTLTQTFKRLVLRHVFDTKTERKRATCAFAFAIGALPVVILWPQFSAMGFFAALIVGAAGPGAYEVVDRILADRWPWWRRYVTASGAER